MRLRSVRYCNVLVLCGSILVKVFGRLVLLLGMTDEGGSCMLEALAILSQNPVPSLATCQDRLIVRSPLLGKRKLLTNQVAHSAAMAACEKVVVRA